MKFFYMAKIFIHFLIVCWATVTKIYLFSLFYFLPNENVTIKTKVRIFKKCHYFSFEIFAYQFRLKIFIYSIYTFFKEKIWLTQIKN